MIQRKAYSALMRLAEQFSVIAITGPRQSGKSTLSIASFPDKKYISFDDKYYRELAKSNPGDFIKAFPDGLIIDEAVRVTKPGGAILFAFISIYAIMYSNYLFGNWRLGQKDNFTKDYKVRHFKELIFTGYDIIEFEKLFENKPVEYITTTGVDGPLELAEKLENFSIPDEDFPAFTDWYITFCEKRELPGSATHLLYICRKAY